MRNDTLEARRAYWKKTLTELPVLQLPTSRAYPRRASFSEAIETIELPPDLTNALKTLSGHKGSEDFITLLAAFKVLLARYVSQDDVVVALPIPSRYLGQTDSGTEGFSKTLLVRTKLDGDPSFREARQRVRETTLAAYENAPIPSDALVEALGPHWKDSPSSFFQVMFDLLGDGSEDEKIGGLILPSGRVECGKVKCDLVMSWIDTAAGLRGTLSYNAEIFDSRSIQQMARCLLTLLDGIVNNPDAGIWVLPLLDVADRHKILVEWNATHRDYPTDACLQDLIEAQVRRTPDAAALVFDGEVLTYDDLNRHANRLAHRLRRCGVAPERIVAVLAEGSIETIVGLVAVLKAGGAFLPLDPSYPKERLSLILGDAQPVVVLAQRHWVQKLADQNVPVLILEDDFVAESEANPPNQTTSENAAYVIYTSGSTGLPKGAVNIHRGICNYTVWWREYLKLTGADRFLQKVPLTFDPSVAEIFGALVSGAALVIARPDLSGDTRYLIDTICEQRVTAAFFVPSLLAVFVHDKSAVRCSSLRCVVSGGEALSSELKNRFYAVFPGTELVNIYGPAEAVIAVTAWRCERQSGSGPVPIGRPIANTRLYILNWAMEPVPVGVAGELHIGGVQVARGYLARPELTAKAFVANPFGEGQLYKTGDLARYREDGAIEFLGRIDQQVKLRGLRVEPREIAAALDRHPAVRQSVVIVQNGAAKSDKRLVAYVAAEGLSTSELRQHLQKSLPQCMIPSAFAFLDKLPLTGNGKIDLQALPAPEFKRNEGDFVAPRDLLEAQLVTLWEKALGVGSIGVTDDFFALGGDSLLAVGIFTEIGKMLGKKLPVSTLIQTPTIDKLAAAIRHRSSEPTWSPLVVIQANGSRLPFFGVHHGYGTVMFYSRLAQRLGQDQPFYGLQAHGLDGRTINYRSVKEIAQSYVEAIRTVQASGPYLLGGYSLGGAIAFEMAQQLRSVEEEVALLVLFDACNPARPPRRYALAERIKLRLHATLGLSGADKLRYLSERACAKVVAKMSKWRGDIHRILFRMNRSNRDIVPDKLRGLHVLYAYMQANDVYQPRPYMGQLTLFRAQDPDDGCEHAQDRGWGELARGGLEIHDVPGPHESIFQEPYVETLAQQLQICLKYAALRHTRANG